MIRDIITIDEEKCNGCGLCVNACAEGALAMVDGKARLISDSYCDGLGHCLPECPTGAISISQREADEFSLRPDHPDAQPQAQAAESAKSVEPALGCGCPGSQSRSLKTAPKRPVLKSTPSPAASADVELESELRQWPVQLKLVPVNAPYLNGAKLLIAADCAAYARASFHQDFMRGRITLIGCPKLDSGSYVEKLTEMLRVNQINSIMVARMEVPCCGGLEMAVKQALINSGKMIPWQVVTLGTDGSIVSE